MGTARRRALAVGHGHGTDHRRVARPRPGAGARARAPLVAPRHRRPRRRRARGGARRAGRPSPRSWRCPATSPTPTHRRALVEAAGPRIDLLVNNASVLGPSPQPRLADYPLDVLEQRLPRQRARPAGAGPERAAGAAARRLRAQRDLRRRRRGVRGLGRLRLLQGRARAGHARARRRAPRAADRRRRPGRHEHADAPGGVPRRGHLRPAAARGQRARRCWRSSTATRRSGRYQASAVAPA